MRVAFSLCLPRDGLSVPVVRRICRSALSELGVAADSVSDIEVALTEACTNVLKHAAHGTNEYEVAIEVDENNCRLAVTDADGGFGDALAVPRDIDLAAEGGRGILLMRALVDELKFETTRAAGTIVQLEKHLRFDDKAVAKLLSFAGPSA